MNARKPYLFFALVLGLSTLVGTLVLLGAGSHAGEVHAQGAIHYVATGGVDTGSCSDPANPCQTAQYAVDQAASGAEIWIATGDYNDVNDRGGQNQIVYITKTVVLRGGYSADFAAWDPDAYITTLDAQNNGRVVYISGNISPTVEALRLTGGNATGLGGDPFGDAGGGVYIYQSDARLIRNSIANNVANSDGWTDGLGGGVYLYQSDALVVSNTIASNQASTGGLFSDGMGGGLYADGGAPTLRANHILGNVAPSSFFGSGAGLYFVESQPTVEANQIWGNQVTGSGTGGGVEIDGCPGFTFINNVIADNQADYGGSGLWISHISGAPSIGRLLHNTIARNTGASGAGMRVAGGSVVTMTNTILVGHDTGINVSFGSTATLTATLWGSGDWANDTDWGDVGDIFTGSINIWGNPAFLNPDGGDYHIAFPSAARDQGVDAGVSADMDGESRNDGSPDIGADEVGPQGLQVIKKASATNLYLGDTVTYTIAVTNGGALEVTNVVLTDDLPALQRPLSVSSIPDCSIVDADYGGLVTCAIGDLNPGQDAHITITAQVTTTLPPTLPQTMRNTALAVGDQAHNGDYADTLLDLPTNCHVRLNGALPEYATVQEGVDAAETGDKVWIAGTCVGILEREGLFQQVYLAKSLTLRGGYSADFGAWDPNLYPTTLDADGRGRVVYAKGPVTVTMEALRLTGGDATGLGGGPGGSSDVGGGVFAISATLTLSRAHVTGNIASTSFDGFGGGVGVTTATLTLIETTLADNTASSASFGLGYGGGLAGELSAVRLERSRLENNIASGSLVGVGGGAYFYESALEGNATLWLSNTVSTFFDWGRGGGLYVAGTRPFTLTNCVLAGNRSYDASGESGSGLWVDGAPGALLHPTIARNGDDEGVSTHFSATVAITNAIIVSHEVGIRATGGSSITVNGVLWRDNISNTATGAAVVRVSNAITGDPAFASDGYHITAVSTALDAGVGAGAAADIDGERRDAAPDLGADEYRTCWARLNDDTTDYTHVQMAVDASAHVTDVVEVAGYCAGVDARPRNDTTTTGTVTQVVYLSKTVTIQGGYTTTNWTTPNPISHPTTLDAQGQGRALYVTGDVAPTVAGLRFTGGDAAGLGGWSDPWATLDAGGAVYVITAAITIKDSQVFSNTAEDGGGMFLFDSAATVLDNAIFSNTSNYGAGMSSWRSDATLKGNTFSFNTAGNEGGGLFVSESDATFDGNIVSANSAITCGGGLVLWRSDATLIDTVVVDNQADLGSGLFIEASSPHLLHTTLARNSNGGGVHVTHDGQGNPSAAVLTNTILVSHTTGITVAGGATVSLDSVLWYGNDANAGGLGALTATKTITGVPAFAPDGYHITLASAALDAGAQAGITTDVEGDLRPSGDAPDLGADETTGRLEPDRVGGAVPGGWAVYTHTLTNTANAAQSFILTVSSSAGYTAAIAPTSTGSLAAFDSVAVTVTVQSPAGAISGTMGTTIVTATGSLIGRDTATDVTIVLSNDVAPTLTPGRAANADPGRQVVYTHTLTNRANFTQSFTLEAVSSEGYPVTVLPTSTVGLAAFDGRTVVTVTVQAPAGAMSGTVDTTLITAISQIAPAIFTTVTDTTTVDQVAGITLSPNRSGNANPGCLISYTHTLTNTGNGPDTFALSAVSSQGWDVTTSPNPALAAGAWITVWVAVNVPAGAPADVGAVPAPDHTTLTATSLADGNVSASVTDTTTIYLVNRYLYLPLVLRSSDG